MLQILLHHNPNKDVFRGVVSAVDGGFSSDVFVVDRATNIITETFPVPAPGWVHTTRQQAQAALTPVAALARNNGFEFNLEEP
jgi:hypothetical protein